MKRHTQVAVLLFSMFFTLSFSTHPIKLTSSIIKFDKKSKTTTMDCKVFIDDFAPALNPVLEQKIRDLRLTEQDISIIENYFIAHYKISINDKKLALKFKEYKVKENVMTVSFSIDYTTFKKGDRLKIENELLFEKFPDLQSNWVTVQIPPFLKNYNFESNFENYSYTHTF